MFAIKFIKVPPTSYLIQYRKGSVVLEGPGLSCFYFAPLTSLVIVPMASVEAPFIFNEVTADFQAITIQGQVTYRVEDPKKLAQLMDFTIDSRGRNYVSDDIEKLPKRVVNLIQVLMRAEVQNLPLRSALSASDRLVKTVMAGLISAKEVAALGLNVLGLSDSIDCPVPETVT